MPAILDIVPVHLMHISTSEPWCSEGLNDTAKGEVEYSDRGPTLE
jgi:hypothetical protein